MEPYLREKEGQISGTVYVLTGNLPALEAGVRYLDTDLNRLWEVHPETDRQSHRSWLQQTREYQQYEEIKKEIDGLRSEEHTSELQSRGHLVCRLLLENTN